MKRINTSAIRSKHAAIKILRRFRRSDIVLNLVESILPLFEDSKIRETMR